MAAVAALPAIAQAAIGASVLSSAVAGYSAYSSGKAASKQAQADANAQAAQGRLEAERVLKQKERQQSTARAAAAENGLDVNEGTAIKINDQIEQDGQYDAAIALTNGYNASQRLQAQASQYNSNANMSVLSGALNTASSGIAAYKGWK